MHAADALLPTAEDAVLVRIPVADRDWTSRLPPVPEGLTLTVTLGDAGLMPSADTLVDSGYRIAGVAVDRQPLGSVVDVRVPMEVRNAHPRWWCALVSIADRVFDLRMGPVVHVLAAELLLHQRAARTPPRC